LDKLTDGFVGGELVALSGPTKNGKTLLAQTLTVNFKAAGINSLWFSFEVPARQFMTQIPDDCLFYLPNVLVPHTINWLDDRIVESKLKFNTRAVFIDHLHYLVDLESSRRNISVDIGAVVRRLKRIAIRHNIVLFLLCHSTKAQGPTGEVRELGSMDIRDSSFIPQEADTTWIIQRRLEEDRDNQAMLKVCNHRRTGTMEKRTTLIKDGQLFKQFYFPGAEPEKQATFYGDTLDGGKGNDTLPY
jgi:replicative DNA helicase